METSRITIEGISSVADLVDKKMKMQKTYLYSDFWKEFVLPSDLEAEEKDISHLYNNDKQIVKNGVNQEFEARGIPKRMFTRKNIGFYLLDKQTGVASAKLLERIKKIGSATDMMVDQCLSLSESNGLEDGDKKMLHNTAVYVEGNKNNIIGALSRMRSLPAPVKYEAMKILGANLENE